MELFNGYFNNYNFNDLGLIVAEYSPYVPINEEYEVLEVQGRNGNINIPLGTYPERTKTIVFRIKEIEYSDDKRDLIIDWLTNIEDNRLMYDTNRFYRVKRTVMSDITCSPKLYYEFSVDFICESALTDLSPEEITTTQKNVSIGYNGTMEGTPIIEIYGNGNIQLTCNGETIQISNVEEYVKIDSILLEVTDQNNLSKDWDTIGNYPIFKKGDNEIKLEGTVSKTIITFENNYQ